MKGNGQDLHVQKGYPRRPEPVQLGKPALLGAWEPGFREGSPIPGSLPHCLLMPNTCFLSGSLERATCWAEGA